MLHGSKENSMLVKRLAACTHLYLQPFLRYSGILVASEWFSTVLVSEWVFSTTFCFPLGTPLGQSRYVLHGSKDNSMLVKRIATCTQCTPVFNRLRAIARYWSEIATFSYPLAFNAPVRSGPGKIAVNITRLERGFNACKTPRCIYPSLTVSQ